MGKTDTKNSPALCAEERDAIAKLSFEDAMKQLETIVRKLESGNAELESALVDYTRATALKDHCMAKLEDAKLKVEAIVRKEDGQLATKEFDPS